MRFQFQMVHRERGKRRVKSKSHQHPHPIPSGVAAVVHKVMWWIIWSRANPPDLLVEFRLRCSTPGNSELTKRYLDYLLVLTLICSVNWEFCSPLCLWAPLSIQTHEFEQLQSELLASLSNTKWCNFILFI